MKEKIENLSAFPYIIPADKEKGWDAEIIEGISMRDYFAAKAMQGMVAHFGLAGTYKTLASTSYEIAEEMLKQRSL